MQHLNLKITVLQSDLIASRIKTTSGNFHMVFSIQCEGRSMAKKTINLVIFIAFTCCTREIPQGKVLIRDSLPLPLLFLACCWGESALFFPLSHLVPIFLVFSA